jgi:hypothetical protein
MEPTMKIELIKFIFNEFDHESNYVNHTQLNSGHINDTFFIETRSRDNYILQRINHKVFKDVPSLVNNKVLISKHIRAKFSHLSEKELSNKVLSFVKVKTSENYYLREGENFWNLMIFIDDTVTHELVQEIEIAYEGGKLLGDFLNLTSDFDSSKLVDIIPGFHDMSLRYAQYEASIKKALKDRLTKAFGCRQIINSLKEEMHILQNLRESGKIPKRVTHNDTKISNSLFTKDHKGVCMIDTDTIMQGIVHYDFGDAIRTICNTASEDEKNLSRVTFNLEYYEAYKVGFLEKTKGSLSSVELKYLPLSVKTMIFIMGLRFLTDYLNNDIYYKTAYAEHNLDRTKNQLKLIESFADKIKV